MDYSPHPGLQINAGEEDTGREISYISWRRESFFFFFCGDLVSSHVGYTIPIYIPRQNTTPGVSEKAVRYNTYISDMLETE